MSNQLDPLAPGSQGDPKSLTPNLNSSTSSPQGALLDAEAARDAMSAAGEDPGSQAAVAAAAKASKAVNAKANEAKSAASSAAASYNKLCKVKELETSHAGAEIGATRAYCWGRGFNLCM